MLFRSQNVVTYDAVIDVANDDLKLKPGMTATVSVVTDRRRDVLTIPNAGLRFKPEGAGQGTGAAQRAAQAGQGQAGGARRERPEGAGQGGQNGNWQRRREAEGDDAAPTVVKRTIYVLVDDKPAPREITTGITDGRLTEITGGNLKEGENVIVSVTGQNPGQQRSGQGQRGGLRIL